MKDQNGPNSLSASQTVRQLAAEHGFPLCGIARVPPDGLAPDYDRFAAWLQAGLHGPLEYMRRGALARERIQTCFPWVRSILVLAADYAADRQFEPSQLRQCIARYAQGRDYHNVFRKRLKKLAGALCNTGLCTRAHWYTDTGPVLERSWAQAAGLGWIGKNTCLIHPQAGSYFLLAELLLDTPLQPDSSLAPHCGTCRRCLDSCPTKALSEKGLDARLCLSTWNIEQRNNTPEELWSSQGTQVFGCDICQEVCPFNRTRDGAVHRGDAETRRGAEAATKWCDDAMTPRRDDAVTDQRPLLSVGVASENLCAKQRIERFAVQREDTELIDARPWHQLSLAETIALDQNRFEQLFAQSPVRRTSWKGLRLGAITAAGNLRLRECEQALCGCVADPDRDIVLRAKWAMGMMG